MQHKKFWLKLNLIQNGLLFNIFVFSVSMTIS